MADQPVSSRSLTSRPKVPKAALPGLYTDLVRRLRALGIPVTERPEWAFKRRAGQTDGQGISLDPTLGAKQRLLVLFHELGHMYLHYPRRGGERRPRDEEEYEADLVAAILMWHYTGRTKPGVHFIQESQEQGTYSRAQLLSRHGSGYFVERAQRAAGRIAHEVGVLEPSAVFPAAAPSAAERLPNVIPEVLEPELVYPPVATGRVSISMAVQSQSISVTISSSSSQQQIQLRSSVWELSAQLRGEW